VSVTITQLWHIYCERCSLNRNYQDRTLAARDAAEHAATGCPGEQPLVDKKPARRR
jgi:hypothetical protein